MGQSGAVLVVQRTSSDLRLNPHVGLGLASARFYSGFATGAELDPAEDSPAVDLIVDGASSPALTARHSTLKLPPTDARLRAVSGEEAPGDAAVSQAPEVDHQVRRGRWFSLRAEEVALLNGRKALASIVAERAKRAAKPVSFEVVLARRAAR